MLVLKELCVLVLFITSKSEAGMPQDIQHEQIYSKGVVPSLSWSTLPAYATECRISWNAPQRALAALFSIANLPRSMTPPCGSPVSRRSCAPEAASADVKAIVDRTALNFAGASECSRGGHASGPVGCSDMQDSDDRVATTRTQMKAPAV